MRTDWSAVALALLGVVASAAFVIFVVYSAPQQEEEAGHEAPPGQAAASGQAAAGGARVSDTIKDFLYNPDPLQIAPGTTVTWTQQDIVAHTVTSGSRGLSDAGKLFDKVVTNPGDTFSFTFRDAGTYPYFCRFHAEMNGTVQVGTPAAGAQATPTPRPTPRPFTTVPPSQVQPPP